MSLLNKTRNIRYIHFTIFFVARVFHMLGIYSFILWAFLVFFPLPGYLEGRQNPSFPPPQPANYRTEIER